MSADNQIIIFTTEDEKISVEVRFDEETVWPVSYTHLTLPTILRV